VQTGASKSLGVQPSVLLSLVGELCTDVRYRTLCEGKGTHEDQGRRNNHALGSTWLALRPACPDLALACDPPPASTACGLRLGIYHALRLVHISFRLYRTRTWTRKPSSNAWLKSSGNLVAAASAYPDWQGAWLESHTPLPPPTKTPQPTHPSSDQGMRLWILRKLGGV